MALSASGGLLSGLAWLPFCTGLILLISFVPFFIIAGEPLSGESRFGNRLPFIILLPGFLLFNITALAWIRIAGVPLLITAILSNSFIMTFTFWLALIIKQRAGNVTGNASIIIFWLAMEYATNNIPILSPWLNLGNGLAGETFLLQWYEYTGVAGGTLWVLLTNILLAKAVVRLKHVSGKTTGLKLFIPVIGLIAVPILFSLVLMHRHGSDSERTTEVVLVQPNRDPYTEKFTVPFDRQLVELLAQAAQAVTETTNWIVTPETTIDDPINLFATDSDPYVTVIREFSTDTNSPAFVLGAVTYTPGQPDRLHNSALLIRPGEPTTYYHKSKLVPGIERSLKGAFSSIQRIFPGLGGTSGGYHGQTKPTLLRNNSDSTSAAPVICFESAFGEHVAGFVRMGADFIIVITNDGWWKGTYGYYQHLTFSTLRAIENRRTVVRAANTGVSAIIDSRGNIIAEILWWEKGSINHVIDINTGVTFYTRHGDLLGRTSATASLFILILHLVALPLKNRVALKK